MIPVPAVAARSTKSAAARTRKNKIWFHKAVEGPAGCPGGAFWREGGMTACGLAARRRGRRLVWRCEERRTRNKDITYKV